MKGMNDERGSSNNNWLGFSLSPHMTNTQHQTKAPPTSGVLPNYFYLSSSHLTNNAAPIYGVAGNSEFQSPLSVMPLKSDGSVCIMEALSSSHSQGVVPSSSPKLEDFLGGASMATHHYANAIHSRDAMALSLDSAFYNQQQPFRQQNENDHDHYYYSGLNSNVMYQTTNDQEQTNKQPIPPPTSMSGDEIPCPKTWMDYNYALEQQVNNNNNNNNCMGDLQCLSLSMSPGSQSSCVTASRQISATDTATITDNWVAMETKKRGSEKLVHKKTVHRKSIDTFGQRTSQYRGVTRHRWTGRYEAHLWDNSCKKEGQTRKGRQVYLGGYDMEEKAARSYDLAALKYWGPSTHINFALENYHEELEEMKNMTRQEYVAHLRRKSSGFSRGASIYRGVTRHHQHGRWQARIGRVAGNKDLYLGTFSTQEEAAEAYDIAAIKFRGANAVTNFDISRYDVEKIMTSNTLPTGDVARRNKEEKPNVENVASVCDWKTVQNKQSNGQDQENVTTVGNYQNPAFSVALHEMIGRDSSHTIVDELTAATMVPHFSNASSLVTSLSSSREGSPDKYAAPVFFGKPNDSLISPPSNMIGSWIPTAQMRHVPLTTAHFPVFNAWNYT